jgi:putative transposase
VRFIDEHRTRLGGVESICRVLTEHGIQIAPSGYYAAKRRPPSGRAVRDEALLADIRRIHAANYGVYGARKIWHELRREGKRVARCTVERLMRQAGLTGAVRGKTVRTTVADPGHERAGDRVNRDFTRLCTIRVGACGIGGRGR